MIKPVLNIEQHFKHPEAIKLSFRRLMEPLLVLFNKAASRVLSDKHFYIAYSIPGGVYGFFDNYEASKEELTSYRFILSK